MHMHAHGKAPCIRAQRCRAFTPSDRRGRRQRRRGGSRPARRPPSCGSRRGRRAVHGRHPRRPGGLARGAAGGRPFCAWRGRSRRGGGAYKVNDMRSAPAKVPSAVHAPFTEVLDALRGERVVVPLPRELGLDVALRREALQRLDHLQVRDVEVLVLRRVVVLLRDENALCGGRSVPLRRSSEKHHAPLKRFS